MSQSTFKEALSRLTSDKGFRDEAINDPVKLISEYADLTREELRALANVARVSGADVSNLDPIIDQVVVKPDSAFSDNEVRDVSCCCCCCCGTDGLVRQLA